MKTVPYITSTTKRLPGVNPLRAGLFLLYKQRDQRVWVNLKSSWCLIALSASSNPLSPHDALKHHFTSLKTDLIFLQLRVFE